MISIDATPKQTSSDVRPSTIDPTVRRRVVAASFIGNFVAWFDYAAYGYPTITPAEMDRWLTALRKQIAYDDLDAVLFTSYRNINYYSDFL
jgi:hypothetical protein